ncbi:uncharacterized protein LOC143276893 [Babylonia areolata]|uniref:uncharacterized protein LOC143276893 n=1 Tax=Babylonia areolata TaxID=304850 RepID=UPI003FD13EBD
MKSAGHRRSCVSKCRPLTILVFFVVGVGVWVISSVIFFQRRHGLSFGSSRPSFRLGLGSWLEMTGNLDSGHQTDFPREDNRRVLITHSNHLNHTAIHAEPTPSGSSKEKASHKKEESEEEKEELEEQEEELAKRRSVYEQRCRQPLKGAVENPFYYPPAKLAVCLIPKVGSTFWKRIFYFLHNETNTSVAVSSPFHIDRFFVHFGQRKKTKTAPYNRHKAMFDKFTKAMFTRDPWNRVWSSYVDKLVLPDSWLDHGKAILQRRRVAAKLGSRVHGAGPPSAWSKQALQGAKKCSDDVTFQEFLDYAMRQVDDVHWRPVHLVCNPCTYKPRYVGKVETFSKDSAHILQKVGLSRLVQGHDSHRNHSEDELRMLTKYHFQIYATRAGIRQCLNHSGVAGRLWKAFVLNGYIGENLTFPLEEFQKELDQTRDSMKAGEKATELLLKYHHALPPLSSAQMRQHRRDVMVQEYRKAPRDLLNRLADKFKDDFILFGYEARPEDIFAS